jgi:two-component system nitrogen regulation sensor histidine kinase GlnL
MNKPSQERFTGLDLLASSVLVVDAAGLVRHANPAAEHLLEVSVKSLSRQKLAGFFLNGEELDALCRQALAHKYADLRQDLTLQRSGRDPLHVHSIVSAAGDEEVVVELRENVQQLKLDREERILDQSQANKELIRNLAHEIKNPLGGIRGAAQLLELELPDASLREYTQVIIKEADRLQTLVDRLLAPHRRPHIVGDVNIPRHPRPHLLSARLRAGGRQRTRTDAGADLRAAAPGDDRVRKPAWTDGFPHPDPAAISGWIVRSAAQ